VFYLVAVARRQTETLPAFVLDNIPLAACRETTALNERQPFLDEHHTLTRRFFLRAGAACVAMAGGLPLAAAGAPRPSELTKAVDQLEPFFTAQQDFRDVSRGTPLPHSLPEEKRREVGLTRDTWKLEVVSDPDKPAALGKQFTKADGTALDFAGLMKLADKHAVRFA
jgi:hypothetical protein